MVRKGRLMEKRLVELENKYGGYQSGVPRRQVSPSDPRPAEKVFDGGMIGGDRMSPDRHNYAPVYARHLKGRIDKPVVLVEFGILTGTGLAMWAELLPAGSRIIGFDIDLSHFSDNRDDLERLGAFQNNPVETYELDQFVDNTELLSEVLGGDYVDIVIDDGCHFDNAIMQTLLSVWPFLAAGFVYFIEDNRRVHDQIRPAFPKLTVENHDMITVLYGQAFGEWISRATGYEINFIDPKTYNEKINHKKLFDRNPLLPIVADKYRARKWVADVLGTDAVLKPLIYATDNPDDIPWNDLPADYVVKPNHLSGAVKFIRDGQVDREELTAVCRGWLARKYAPFSMEWAYLPIPPMILVEDLLSGAPDSFKFHCFHGKCHFVKVISGGLEAKKKRCFTFFTPDTWEKIPVSWDRYGHADIPRPDNLGLMVDYAEKLSAVFDYIRVDLALFDGRIYFEEMTNYPTGGHSTLEPIEYDRIWGDLWTITPHYWEKKV